ncbi:MAG: hydrogenase iron-sulfur subunit [Chloroflexota bacterium]
MKNKFPGSSAPDQNAVSSNGAEELERIKRNPLLIWLERLSLPVEKLFTGLGGTYQLNPFYHTGTLSVFLWLIVGLTGMYLSLFYQFGFDAAYASIAKMESQLIAHVIRAIHRYASGSAVIVTLLHGYRLLFMDRFRGPRWLAWISGVVMALLLWVDGVTGYWLIWDKRAQVITESMLSFLKENTPFYTIVLSSLLTAKTYDSSWIFIFILLFIHIALFLAAGLFFWWHIIRLNRPKFLPPRYWLIIAGLVIIIGSALFPLGMLPKADFNTISPVTVIDPFFLFYLPFGSGQFSSFFWICFGLTFGLSVILPWMNFGRKKSFIRINKETCIGCRACAADCPYKAIQMVSRDGNEQGKKLTAQVDPAMCVGCGVCLGSCDPGCITLSELSETEIWQQVEKRLKIHADQVDLPVTLLFTCERHAAQGARKFIQTPGILENKNYLEIIPLPCVGVIAPSIVSRAITAGAGEVRIVGCPVEDCAAREGNQWEAARLDRTRLPRLKKGFENAPIHTFWLSPDSFSKSLVEIPTGIKVKNADLETGMIDLDNPGWFTKAVRNFLPLLVVLGIILSLQVWASRTWLFRPIASGEARVQFVFADPRKIEYSVDRFEEKYFQKPNRLILMDGNNVLFEESYPFIGKRPANPIVFQTEINTGEHHAYLKLVNVQNEDQALVIYDHIEIVKKGQVWVIIYDPIFTPDYRQGPLN